MRFGKFLGICLVTVLLLSKLSLQQDRELDQASNSIPTSSGNIKTILDNTAFQNHTNDNHLIPTHSISEIQKQQLLSTRPNSNGRTLKSLFNQSEGDMVSL